MFTKKIVYNDILLWYELPERIFSAFDEKHLGGRLVIHTDDGSTQKRYIDDFFGFKTFFINTDLTLNKEKRQVECTVTFGIPIKITAVLCLFPILFFIKTSIADRMFDFTFFLWVLLIETGIYGILLITYMIDKKRRIGLLKKILSSPI